DKKILDELVVERKKVTDQVKAPLLREYLRIQKKWKTTTVATDTNGGRCNACNMSLRPQFLQDLRKGDQVMHCESCGRFLYYQPTVVIDEQGAAVGTRAEPEG